MRSRIEACQPYDSGPGREPPSHISDILDRLDAYELRSLAAVFSAASPASFEQMLLEIWERRRRYSEAKPA